jgi:broad specificity phosphatase PhoE
MAELLIIRHGQASFGAQNYDQLSALGESQSRAVGAYLRDIGWVPDRLICGSLVRQRQTLEAMGFDGAIETHAGFDEYDLHGFQTSELTPVDMNQDRKSYFRALKALVLEWQQDAGTGARESWGAFCGRTDAAMAFACATQARRVLVVSSGGVIGQLVRAALQAPAPMMMELNLQVKNTSLTRFVFSGSRRMLQQFNAAPHIDADPTLLTYA